MERHEGDTVRDSHTAVNITTDLVVKAALPVHRHVKVIRTVSVKCRMASVQAAIRAADTREASVQAATRAVSVQAVTRVAAIRAVSVQAATRAADTRAVSVQAAIRAADRDLAADLRAAAIRAADRDLAADRQAVASAAAEADSTNLHQWKEIRLLQRRRSKARSRYIVARTKRNRLTKSR